MPYKTSTDKKLIPRILRRNVKLSEDQRNAILKKKGLTNIVVDAQYVPPKTKAHIQSSLNFALTQVREFENLFRFWEGEVKTALAELEQFNE